MDERAFEAAFNGSPVRRAGFNGLRRNIAIAMGNSGLALFATRLAAWSEEADEGLRSAARWALRRLGSGNSRERDPSKGLPPGILAPFRTPAFPEVPHTYSK